MPLFPDYIIQEVADKNDIYDVISKTVRLKKAGSSYIGLCPFHSEKTPSFSVSPRRGIFKCFGCGEGGDVIRFVMKSEGLSFFDAVTKLADNANISLPKVSGYSKEAEEKKKEHNNLIYEINKEAASFFFASIKSSPKAIEYFKKRQLDSQTVKMFWLGFAPDGWTSLFEHLKSKGYAEGDIFDAGLVKKHESGRYYDTFRNRIMFPIFDAKKNIIGFGGRVMDDSKPKYLNSQDSPIFSKSRNLYGFNIALHSKKDFCILSEGYMDTIALIKSGYDNTVATLGTALTSQQAKLLSNYFKEVVICYDSDKAGRNATLRAITVLREHKIKISVLDLKAEKDPDEYIKTYGKARFDSALSARKADMVYLMDYFGENYDLKKSDDVINYISDVTAYLKLIKSSVEADVYVGMLSSQTGVGKEAIFSQIGLKKDESPAAYGLSDADVINVVNKSGLPKDNKDYLDKTRSLLLGTLFYDKRLFERFLPRLDEDMFERNVHKAIFSYIKACFENGEKLSNTTLINSFESEDDIQEACGILALDIQSDDSAKAVEDYINEINAKSGPERALELLRQNKITLEQFNEIINNKG
ncbi:MAG: DNA primase [Clostridia bacterium]|nr:DNA primase [Clostridia bacterium]